MLQVMLQSAARNNLFGELFKKSLRNCYLSSFTAATCKS